MSVLVTQQAPDFTAPAVMPEGVIKEDFKLSDLRGKYVVLFFWPLDFTFVCPTEIIAHHKRMENFKGRNVEVVGVSIDSQFTHIAWRDTAINDGGIGAVDFPIVADIKHEITQAYGIEHPDGVAMRASFLIDKDGVVQHQVVNNLPPAVCRTIRGGLPGRVEQRRRGYEAYRRRCGGLLIKTR